MYLPFQASSFFSFLIPSSFSLSLTTSFVSSSISVSSQSVAVILPNQIPKKDQINNGMFFVFSPYFFEIEGNNPVKLVLC